MADAFHAAIPSYRSRQQRPKFVTSTNFVKEAVIHTKSTILPHNPKEPSLLRAQALTQLLNCLFGPSFDFPVSCNTTNDLISSSIQHIRLCSLEEVVFDCFDLDS